MIATVARPDVEKRLRLKSRQDSINAVMEKATADSRSSCRLPWSRLVRIRSTRLWSKAKADSIAKAEADKAKAKQSQAKPKEEPKQAPTGQPKVGMKKPGDQVIWLFSIKQGAILTFPVNLVNLRPCFPKEKALPLRQSKNHPKTMKRFSLPCSSPE